MAVPALARLDAARRVATMLPMERLDADAMTWTALLSKWVEYAQAALALPDDAEGHRWRRAVPHIIALQAVTFALNDLDRLLASERPYARDKAEVLIDENTDAFERIWSDAELPEMVIDILEQAADALVAAEWCGLTELIWRGDASVLVPALDVDELLNQLNHADCGTFAVAQPGTFIMPGEPIAWWCDIDGAANLLIERFPGSELASASSPRQIFRQIDDDGRIMRDVIAWTDSEDIDGLPLLLPLIAEGERIGSFTLNRQEWEDAQRDQVGDDRIEVVDLTSDAEVDSGDRA